MLLDPIATLVDREWSAFADLLDAEDTTSGTRWLRATRCTDWSVADLVAHVCWGVSMESDALRRARTGTAGRAAGCTPSPDTPPHAMVSMLRASAASLAGELNALGDVDPALPIPMPYGDIPVATVLDIFGMEAGVHRSDLSHALAADDRLPSDVCRASWAFLAEFLPLLANPAARRPRQGTTIDLVGEVGGLRARFADGTWTVGHPSEPGRPAAVVAGDDSTVLLYALGRRPLGPGLAVRGDQRQAALFKSYMPGP